ncbi:MAG: hypothetical protein OEU80_15795 [Deltaproteobacteria bacterium]|nr:hypothetical protein [Deltaproteobacteria bacterium]
MFIWEYKVEPACQIIPSKLDCGGSQMRSVVVMVSLGPKRYCIPSLLGDDYSVAHVHDT